MAAADRERSRSPRTRNLNSEGAYVRDSGNLQDSQEDDWYKLLPAEAGQLSSAIGEAILDTRSGGSDRAKRWDKVDEIRRLINLRIAKDELAASQ